MNLTALAPQRVLLATLTKSRFTINQQIVSGWYKKPPLTQQQQQQQQKRIPKKDKSYTTLRVVLGTPLRARSFFAVSPCRVVRF